MYCNLQKRASSGTWKFDDFMFYSFFVFFYVAYDVAVSVALDACQNGRLLVPKIYTQVDSTTQSWRPTWYVPPAANHQSWHKSVIRF